MTGERRCDAGQSDVESTFGVPAEETFEAHSRKLIEDEEGIIWVRDPCEASA
jgi:hypothetical protein